MQRSLGPSRQAVLGALSDSRRACLTVAELADLLGCSERQTRTAVRALQARGLVVTTGGRASMTATGLRVWLPERHADAGRRAAQTLAALHQILGKG